MEFDKAAREGRLLLGEPGHGIGCQRRIEDRIARRLAQHDRELFGILGGEILPFEREEVRHPFDQALGQGPVVMFDLAEIGRADRQLLRQIGLHHAAPFAKGAQLCACKDSRTCSHREWIVCKLMVCKFAN